MGRPIFPHVAYVWIVATAVPPHEVTVEDTRRLAHVVFGDLFDGDLGALDRIIENTRVRRRFVARPPEEILRPRGIDETSRWHAEAVRELGGRALRAALEQAGVGPGEVDALVVCASTGFMIPSLDAYLVNEVGLPPSTRRLPFNTLGCAGGAGGLIRGAEALAARGGRGTIAVVAAETPSLTFRIADRSMANAIATTLFGDGAAALVLRGEPPPRPSVRVRACRTWLQPDAYEVMAFREAPDGYEVVLSPDVPDVAVRGLERLVGELTAEAGATPRDLEFVVLHPGGARVVERVSAALGLAPGAVDTAWAVLRDHGNMSSATVLFVLAEALRRGVARPGALGLMAAFGPGFATELLLIEGVGP